MFRHRLRSMQQVQAIVDDVCKFAIEYICIAQTIFTNTPYTWSRPACKPNPEEWKELLAVRSWVPPHLGVGNKFA